jgi:hypothetical protein
MTIGELLNSCEKLRKQSDELKSNLEKDLAGIRNSIKELEKQFKAADIAIAELESSNIFELFAVTGKAIKKGEACMYNPVTMQTFALDSLTAQNYMRYEPNEKEMRTNIKKYWGKKTLNNL